MIKIQNVAEETKEKIKRSSAYSLPNNPTGAGYKAQDIKNALFKPIVDGQYSVLAEIEKLINELNKVLPSVKISEMKLSGKDNTLHLLDENMQAIAAINLPFVKLTDFEENTKNIPNNIALILNETNYRLKAKLSSQNGVVAESNEIDLPIESMIIGASYENGVLTLQLKNNEDGSLGNTIQVNISDLVSGLVNETDFETFQDNVNGEIGNLHSGIEAIDRYATENIINLQDRVSKIEQNGSGTGGGASNKELTEIKEKVDEITIKQAELKSDTTPFMLVPNTIYVANETIKDLELDFVEGMYHLIFTIDAEFDDTSKNHTIRFNYDVGELRYLGKAPDFKGGETWEISIHNGIIASGKVVSE